MLSNGMLNTERNAHALQTGFGMMGLRRVLPSVPIKGLVIVCAADGTKMYEVDDRFIDPKLFSIGSVRPSFGTYVKNITFQKIPTNPESMSLVQKALANHGCAFTKKDIRKSFGNTYGSFTVASSSATYTVVALVYTKSPSEDVGEKKRRQLNADVEKLWLDKKKKIKVRGCIVHFSAQKSPIHRVEFISKSYLPQ